MGLIRHYWVIAKLAVTVGATIILLLHLPAVTALAERVASGSTDLVVALLLGGAVAMHLTGMAPHH